MKVRIADVLFVDTEEFARKALEQFVKDKQLFNSDYLIAYRNGTLFTTHTCRGYTMDDDRDETQEIQLTTKEKEELIGIMFLYGKERERINL